MDQEEVVVVEWEMDELDVVDENVVVENGLVGTEDIVVVVVVVEPLQSSEM